MVFLALLLSVSAVHPSCAPGYQCTSDEDCHQMSPSTNLVEMFSNDWVKCINKACVVKTAGTIGGACGDTVVCPTGTDCIGSPNKVCQATKSATCACATDAECSGVCRNNVCTPSHTVPAGGNCTNSNDCMNGYNCNSTMQCQWRCDTACAADEECGTDNKCHKKCDFGTYLNQTENKCMPWKASGAACAGDEDEECGMMLGCNDDMVCGPPFNSATLGQTCGKMKKSMFSDDMEFQMTALCSPSNLYCSMTTMKCENPTLAKGANCTEMGSCAGGLVCAPDLTIGAMVCQDSTAGKACSDDTECNGGMLSCKCTSQTASVCTPLLTGLETYPALMATFNGMQSCISSAKLPPGCTDAMEAAMTMEDASKLTDACNKAAADLYCCLRCKDTTNFLSGIWSSVNSDVFKLSCNPNKITIGAPVCTPRSSELAPLTCGASTLVAQAIAIAVFALAFLW